MFAHLQHHILTRQCLRFYISRLTLNSTCCFHRKHLNIVLYKNNTNLKHIVNHQIWILAPIRLNQMIEESTDIYKVNIIRFK